MEIPHFAALRGTERELVILRSETGESWREHHCDFTEEELNQILNGMDESKKTNHRDHVITFRLIDFLKISNSQLKTFHQHFDIILQTSNLFSDHNRTGFSRGAGKEKNMSHHNPRLPTILCGGVTDKARQSFDWARGRRPQ